VDNVTHSSDSVGGYATVGAADNIVWLWCPVWLPQGTYVDKIVIKTTFADADDSVVKVEAFFISHRTTADGGSYASYGSVSATGNSTTAGRVTSASLTTATTICNDNSGVSPCDTENAVQTYYVWVKRTTGKHAPTLYSVWLGDPSGDSDGERSPGEPVACGPVIEAWQAGDRLTEAELNCLPLLELQSNDETP
jgi:hypothetical protein